MEHSSSCPAPFSSGFPEGPRSLCLLLIWGTGNRLSWIFYFCPGDGHCQPKGWRWCQALAHWVGLVPPFGSAGNSGSFLSQSESVHQEENLVLGPICAQKSVVVPPGEKGCRRWVVLSAHSWALPCPELCRQLVPFSRGATEVAANCKLPLSQRATFLYSANHFFY